MGSQRVGHDWANELNWTELNWTMQNWLIGKDPDARKDWRQEKGMTEDEMVGWHHWLNVHEFEQALGVGDGKGSLACCDPWAHKESDMTEQLNWNKYYHHLDSLVKGTGSINSFSSSEAFLPEGFFFIVIKYTFYYYTFIVVNTHLLLYGGLVCCSPWGRRELDMTEWLNWTENIHNIGFTILIILSVQFKGIKYIHSVVEMALWSIPETFYHPNQKFYP